MSALTGVLVAGVALGAAELFAGLRPGWRSPVLDVGDRVIDAAPAGVKEFAIDTFGTNDKPALLVGIGVLLTVYAAVVGLVALRWRVSVGLVGVAAFGVVGVWAARSRRGGAPWTVTIPSVGGALVGIGVLLVAARVVAGPGARAPVPAGPGEADGAGRAENTAGTADAAGTVVAAGPSPDPARRPPGGGGVLVAPTVSGRRVFLGRSGAFLIGATVAAGTFGAVGRWLGGRFGAAQSRAAVRLPPPVVRQALPAGVQLDVPGLMPFRTPNDRFYRIDTALTAPQVPTADYRLRIHGLVDREVELTYDELLDLDLIERDITLTCVSNEVGGNLVGNASWLGARLADLLARAGVRPGADQVVGRSVDGFECGFPLSVALDGRDAIVAVGMNGEPLPIAHGFPARLIVPGLYGYVSATKWLSEIELTTFAEFDHYWLKRGWAQEGPIKLMSRIDTPRGLARVAAGTVPVAGVAWAQHVGISAVEVQIDDGAWEPATLAATPSADTWVQWVRPWSATPGRHLIRVRAVDATGAIQTADRIEPIPDGATGRHEIVVTVE